jgi:hypothetical protein
MLQLAVFLSVLIPIYINAQSDFNSELKCLNKYKETYIDNLGCYQTLDTNWSHIFPAFNLNNCSIMCRILYNDGKNINVAYNEDTCYCSQSNDLLYNISNLHNKTYCETVTFDYKLKKYMEIYTIHTESYCPLNVSLCHLNSDCYINDGCCISSSLKDKYVLDFDIYSLIKLLIVTIICISINTTIILCIKKQRRRNIIYNNINENLLINTANENLLINTPNNLSGTKEEIEIKKKKILSMYKIVESTNEIDDEENCSICTETLKNNLILNIGHHQIIKLNCDHLYHHDCFNDFINYCFTHKKIEIRCPLCRDLLIRNNAV